MAQPSTKDACYVPALAPPLPLPEGVSNLAVGRPMPEPELLWAGQLVLLMTCFGQLWKRRRALSA